MEQDPELGHDEAEAHHGDSRSHPGQQGALVGEVIAKSVGPGLLSLLGHVARSHT
jgi:hypothetical protein